MPSYRPSSEATADLETIGDLGIDMFGPGQAVLSARADFKRHF
jgi:plasmid stabilization system protein ParE